VNTRHHQSPADVPRLLSLVVNLLSTNQLFFLSFFIFEDPTQLLDKLMLNIQLTTYDPSTLLNIRTIGLPLFKAHP